MHRDLLPTLSFAIGCCQFAACAFGACTVEFSTADKPVVLENRLVKVVVDPSRGGTVSSFVLNAAEADLTATWEDQPVGQGFGLFGDRVTTLKRERVRDYETSAYAAKVVTERADEVAVQVIGTSPSGTGKVVQFSKTYRLRADSAELLVDYEVANIGQRPVIGSIWTTNVVRAGNAAEPMIYHYPTPKGTRVERYSRLPTCVNVFINDAPRGWCGAIGETNRLGLAFAMSYPTLKTLYSFLSGRTANQDFPTLEWWTRNIMLKPVKPLEGEGWGGKPWASRVSVMPLRGLPRLDGYANGLAVAIEESGGRAQVSALSAMDRKMSVIVSCGRVSGDASQTVTDAWDVAATEPMKKAYDQMRIEEGTLVRVEVRDGGKSILACERAFGPAEALAEYVLAPAEEKVAEPKADTSSRLTRSFITPHVKWASPSKHEPVKTLFMVKCSMQRDIVELAQRMTLDFTVIPTQYSHYQDTASNAGLMFYYPGFDSVKEFHSALSKQKWDAVCICSRFWIYVPEKTRQLLFERVREGMALVNVCPRRLTKDMRAIVEGPKSVEGSSVIRANVPFGDLPVLDADPTGERWVTAIELGKGRIVLLNYSTICVHNYRGDLTSLTPAIRTGAVPEWPAHEYYYSLVARAFLWSVRRLPDEPMRLEPSSTNVGEIGQVRVSRPDGRGGSIRFRAHTKWGDAVAEGTASLGRDGAAELLLGGMSRAGTVFVDVWRLEDGKIADWGTASLSVASPVQEVRVCVPDEAYEAGSAWQVSVETDANAKMADATLTLTVTDAHDRVVSRTARDIQIEPGTKRYELPLRIALPLTVRHTLRASVTTATGELGSGRAVLYAKVRHVPNFDFLVWGGGWVSHMGKEARQQLKKIGVTIHETGANLCRKKHVTNEWLRSRCDEILQDDMGIAFQNVNWIGGYAAKDNPLARLYCLDDPAYMEGVVEALRRGFRGLGKMGVSVCSTGDEISIGRYASFNDFCQSEHSVAACRRWLAERYSSIGKLNREWDTKYAAFEEVPGIKWADVEKKANKAPWAEFRIFMETRLENYLRTFSAECKQLLPGVRTGFDGTTTLCSYNGFDWWRISGVTDMITLYRTAATEHYLGDFFRARGVKPHFSMWLSAGASSSLSYRPWQMLFQGMTSADYWYEPLLLNPDFTINEYAARLGEQVTEIQKGIGTLLLTAERQHDPIAILYSQASVHAATIEGPTGRPGPTELNNDHFAWAFLTQDAGFTASFISYEQLAGGHLANSKHRVLVLPLCYALSEAEVTAIEAFVVGGGLLICDSSPGLYNGHVRELRAGRLDDLLGVKRAEAERTSVPGVQISVPELRGAFTLPWPAADRDIELLDASALGEAQSKGATKTTEFGGMLIRSRVADAQTIPAVIAARRGKGQTCYLNLPMWRYKEIRGTDRGQELVALLLALLRRVSVEPVLPVSAQGAPAPELMATRWKWGEGLYVGLLKAMNSRSGKQQATLTWDRPGVAYDVRAKRVLGRDAGAALSLSEDRPLVLARLPYEVAGISAAGPEQAEPLAVAKVVFDVQTSGGRATHHMLHCTVTDPSGQARDCYTRNVVAEDGRGVYALTSALNDPPGMWAVQAEDVVSGKRATMSIRNGQ